jgi:DNA-binding MarR family transcriptional regulator
MVRFVNIFLGRYIVTKRSDNVSEIIDNLRKLFQVVNEQSKKAEKETGLTGPQLWAIKTIAQGSPIMVSELARRMYLHPATVVGILDRLELHKLVVRVRSTTDRRVVRVELTAQGNAVVRKAPTVAQGRLVTGLEQLTAMELNNIADGLNRLVDILGAQNIPAKLIRSPEVNNPMITTSSFGQRKRSRKRLPVLSRQ